MKPAALYSVRNISSNYIFCPRSLSDQTYKTVLVSAAAEGNHRAQLALDMFAYRVKKYIGSYAAALGGVDIIVFTGGIGEKSALIRSKICERLEHLGIRIDEDLNSANADIITLPERTCTVRIIQTEEDLMIARQTHDTIFAD